MKIVLVDGMSCDRNYSITIDFAIDESYFSANHQLLCCSYLMDNCTMSQSIQHTYDT